MIKLQIQQYPSGKWQAYTSTHHPDDTYTSYERVYDMVEDIDIRKFVIEAREATLKHRTTCLQGSK